MPLDNLQRRELGVDDWPLSQPALKEDAIRYAAVLLNREEVELPESPEEDEVETRLIDETKRLLGDNLAEVIRDSHELNAVLSQIEMRTDAAEGILKGLLNDVVEDHQHFSLEAKELHSTERRAGIAQTAEATRYEITRDPKPNTTATISGFAVGFVGVEALVTAASFIGQTGATGAAGAVGLALTAACTNIGLGGYLAGTVLIPRSFSSNSSFLVAWVYRLLLLISVTWLLAVNVLLGHFRASSGDFDAAFASFILNPLNVGDMTGLLLTGFGLILSAVWCLKFYNSQEPYLEYGALGEELQRVRALIKDNHAAYNFAVRSRADVAIAKLDAAAEDAVIGHQLAREIRLRADGLIKQFSNNQDEILSKATETAMYRRSVIREMLSPHGPVPKYLAEPINLSFLQQPGLNAKEQAEFEEQIERQKVQILKACTHAKEDVERIVAQALRIPFGAAIYPSDIAGGYHVEQSTE